MTKYSFPKEKIKILLLEKVHPAAIENFKQSGYTSIESLNSHLNEDELCDKITDIRILGIRSKTQVTEKALYKAKKLLTIGAFCIGTNQINLVKSTALGIGVFNSPYSSSRSVAELVIGDAIMLLRKAFDKCKNAHVGIWDKDSKNCFEIRNKTIGVIGYGPIGSQVSVLAESIGMKVVFFDVEKKLSMGNARQVKSLDELLKISDIITLHVPETKSTIKLIGEPQIKLMKKGAILINLSRAKVMDNQAVAEAIKNNHLGGCAVDVYENEPKTKEDKFNCILQGLPNVILTPHIGGSTEEAQENIGLDVSGKILDYLDKGISYGSLTVPELNLPIQENAHRFLHIHENVPGVLSEINTKISLLKANVLGQYLKTNEKIGYVVIDIDKGNSTLVLNELNQVKHTLKVRCLF